MRPVALSLDHFHRLFPILSSISFENGKTSWMPSRLGLRPTAYSHEEGIVDHVDRRF